MNRVLMLVAGFAAAGQVGCSSARYVTRGSDEGVVAVQDRSNGWPTYNHDKAVELIREHVGPDYEIVEEWSEKSADPPAQKPIPTRDNSTNNQMFFMPSDNPRSKPGTPTADATEWRIRYRRKMTGTGGWVSPTGGTASQTGAPLGGGTVPATSGSGVMPAAFQTAPSIPPVLPAGGATPSTVISPPALPAGK